MTDVKKVEWVLRVAAAASFVGQGAMWLRYRDPFWVRNLLHTDFVTAGKALLVMAVMNFVIAAVILVRPVRAVLLWAAIWAFWIVLGQLLASTAGIWNFFSGFTHWGAPLALLILRGWPRSARDWVR